MPELSIIIPTVEAKSAMRLIESIRAHRPQCSFEVILVDDSGNGAIKDFEFQRPEQNSGFTLKIIQNKTNLGPASSRNNGAKTASAQWLLYLDADVEVDDLFFKRLAKHLNQNATIVGVYHYPAASDSFYSLYYHYRLIHGYQNNQGSPVPILGAVFCIKRETFFKVGGFDEKYRFASVEDIDLSKRMSEEDLEVLIDTELQVVHHKQLSFFKLLKNDYLRTRDRVHFLFRKPNSSKRTGSHFDHSEQIYLISLFLPVAVVFLILVPHLLTYILVGALLGLSFSYNLRLSPDRDIAFAVKATAFVLIDYSVVWHGLVMGTFYAVLSRQKHLYGQV